MNRPRIAWISRGPNEIYLNLARELAKRYDVTFICRRAAHLKKPPDRSEDFSYLPLPYCNNVFNPAILLKDIWYAARQEDAPDNPSFIWLKKLGGFLRLWQPDYIIANGIEQPAVWQAIYYCLMTGTPLVLQTEMKQYPAGIGRNTGARCLLHLLRPAFRRAHAILPWTKEGYKFVCQHWHGARQERIHLLPPGIDVSLFTPRFDRRVVTEKIRMSLVARFVSYKRHTDAIEATQMAREKYKLNCHLSIVGTDPLGQEPIGASIRQYVANHQLEKFIHFKERISRKDMPEFFSQHDINLLTSYEEPIGMVVPESMACGIPNIVSDSSGATTYIKQGQNGLVYKTGKVEELAGFINKLADVKFRLAMGDAARQAVANNFSLEKITSHLISVLEQPTRHEANCRLENIG